MLIPAHILPPSLRNKLLSWAFASSKEKTFLLIKTWSFFFFFLLFFPQNPLFPPFFYEELHKDTINKYFFFFLLLAIGTLVSPENLE